MIKDITSLYQTMMAFSFKDVLPEKILSEYHLLMWEVEEVLNQEEYRSIKTIHADNIEALLWDKMKSEQPNVTEGFQQITEEALDALYPNLVTNLQKIIDLPSNEYDVALIKVTDDLIKELQENIGKILDAYLPGALMKEYRRKILNLGQQLKQESIDRKLMEIGVNQTQWKFMCEYFLDKITNDGTIPFDPKILKKPVPVHLLILLYARRIRKFTKDLQESMKPRLISIANNLKIKIANEELTAEYKIHISKEWVEELVKVIDKGKYINEELCFIAFSVFISLVPFYDKGIVSSFYNPSDRCCIYNLIYKLKKHSPTSVVYRFINWRNFLIFESCLGTYLSTQKPIDNIVPKDKSIDVYNLITKQYTDLQKVLGDSSYNFLNSHPELTTAFYVENLAPERRSPSLMLCVSGYLSEKDVSLKQWDGVIKSIIEESIMAYKWPAKTQYNLGKKIFGQILPYVAKAKNEGVLKIIVDSFQATHKTVFDDYKEASQKAKLAGKLLALMLSLREPFGSSTVVNMIGFSLGTKVIAECVKTLYKLKAINIIGNVFLFGGAASFSNEKAWKDQLRAIGGRLVNCYSSSDWILQILKESKGKKPIGLRPIFAEGKERPNEMKVENYNVTNIAGGHLKYRSVFQLLLQQFYP